MIKTLSVSEISSNKKRLKSLHMQLADIGPVMRGSIVTNGKNHPQPYFSLNKNKKTRLMYLGEGRVEQAKMMVENYRRMTEITEEMTEINMLLLKNNAL